MSITKTDVLNMSVAEVFAAIKNPKTQGEMVALMKDREVAVRVNKLLQERAAGLEEQEAAVDKSLARTAPAPSTEALAAQATEMAAAPETPETSIVPEEGTVVSEAVTPPAQERKKVVREYQVRDEDGNPIGRPTHLEAWSAEEMLDKMQTAHENATRAFHRLKKQKLSFKAQEKAPLLTPEEIKAAAEIAVSEKDASKAADVIKAQIEAQYSDRERKIEEKTLYENGRAISNEFMRRHLHDYNPCDANKKLFGDYFAEHQLEFTLDNLEAAFVDLMDEGKLVKVAKTFQTSAAQTPNTPVAAAVAEAPATELPAQAAAAAVTEPAVAQTPAVATSPAVAEATATTPVAAVNPAPTATRRPAVPAGIQPGTLSAKRPELVDPVQARKQFLQTVKKMDPEVMKTKLKTDPQFVKQLESYGIRIR